MIEGGGPAPGPRNVARSHTTGKKVRLARTRTQEGRKPLSYIHVRDPEGASELAEALTSERRFALDCEAAGFHRYSDRLCLVQLTVTDRTYILDPLALDPAPLLRGPLEDPEVEVVMHGADFDLRLLARDLGIRLRGLYDTQVAASLLGESALGLASLLESRLGVKLSKKYQRADWAERPLPDDMLEYAANDTRHLLELADLLARDVREAGREAWVAEECALLERVALEVEDAQAVDPVTRVKGARTLSPRQVTALREALDWRDRLARGRDRAPFRIVGDQPLLEAVLTRPDTPEALRDLKGFPRALARDEGRTLLDRLAAVEALADSELRPYPAPSERGPGRPPPEVEARLARLKDVRNERADALGVDRGTLIPNATLLAIATRAPSNEGALGEVDGIRRWQVEVLGRDLLSAVRD